MSTPCGSPAGVCAAGIAAEVLDGTTPLATRRAILQRLHTGATRVVANCAVLTEGFDEPSVDCIIMARPTQSTVLYQQMLGRGMRTYPGKTDCLLLDVVGVSTYHTLHTAVTVCGQTVPRGPTCRCLVRVHASSGERLAYQGASRAGEVPRRP